MNNVISGVLIPNYKGAGGEGGGGDENILLLYIKLL